MFLTLTTTEAAFIADASNFYIAAVLEEYIQRNYHSDDDLEFATWAIGYLNENRNVKQAFILQFENVDALSTEFTRDAGFNQALKVTLLAYQTNSFSSSFAVQSICQSQGIAIDPVLEAYFNTQVAIIKFQHPNWSMFRVYWEASKEIIYLSLDIGGLVPLIGEVCDLTNGVIYTVQGDGLNASLSFASAIPVAGWASTGAKFAMKAVDATNAAKTTLKWIKKANGVLDFGRRGQLRQVLKLAPGNLLQAHHIIPWEFTTNTVVQKAAQHGFHMNEALNGIGLAKSVHVEGMVHSVYNDVISLEFKKMQITLEVQI